VTTEISNPWDSKLSASLYDAMYTNSEDVELFLSLAREAGGPILEIACGTGRCMLPLIRAGFDTVGIDSAEPMLDRLRHKLTGEPDEIRHRATPLKDDGRIFRLPLRFGMIFTAANSFTYFLTKDDQQQVARNVFDHLRPGGLFVIDVFNPDLKRLLRPELKRTEVGTYVITQETRRVDHCQQIIEMTTTFRLQDECQASIQWSLRYSFRFELEHLLEKAGFEILSLWGDHRRRAFGEAVERLFVVARKPPDDHMTVVQLMQAEVAQTL
jgi:SAM-dependent methyltransferase